MCVQFCLYCAASVFLSFPLFVVGYAGCGTGHVNSGERGDRFFAVRVHIFESSVIKVILSNSNITNSIMLQMYYTLCLE